MIVLEYFLDDYNLDNLKFIASDEKYKHQNFKIQKAHLKSYRSQAPDYLDKWDKTTEKDTINHYKILTEESTCNCSVGGKISVQDKGHGEKHEIVWGQGSF